MNQPSFYAIIPANVRYCKEIEQGAKLLYGEITALTHAEGYCWATNDYFAELYGVDKRTIQNWIQSLKDQKFITIETNKNGINWQRRIWISLEIKKMFTKGKNLHPPVKESSPPHEKNFTHNNKENNTSNKNTPIVPKGDEREAYGVHVRLSKEEYQKAKELCGESLDGIIEEMNDYCAAHGKKYKDYLAAIRTWWKKRASSPKKSVNRIDENAEWAKEIAYKMKYVARCHIESDCFVFEGMGNYAGEYIKFSEPSFKDRIINRLRKMGLIQYLNDD